MRCGSSASQCDRQSNSHGKYGGKKQPCYNYTNSFRYAFSFDFPFSCCRLLCLVSFVSFSPGSPHSRHCFYSKHFHFVSISNAAVSSVTLSQRAKSNWVFAFFICYLPSFFFIFFLFCFVASTGASSKTINKWLFCGWGWMVRFQQPVQCKANGRNRIDAIRTGGIDTEALTGCEWNDLWRCCEMCQTSPQPVHRCQTGLKWGHICNVDDNKYRKRQKWRYFNHSLGSSRHFVLLSFVWKGGRTLATIVTQEKWMARKKETSWNKNLGGKWVSCWTFSFPRCRCREDSQSSRPIQTTWWRIAHCTQTQLWNPWFLI